MGQILDLVLTKRCIEKYKTKYKVIEILKRANTTPREVLDAWAMIEKDGLAFVDEESVAVAIAKYLCSLSPEARRNSVRALECITDLSTKNILDVELDDENGSEIEDVGEDVTNIMNTDGLSSVEHLSVSEEIIVVDNPNDSQLGVQDLSKALIHVHSKVVRLANGTLNYNYALPSSDVGNNALVIPELKKMDNIKNVPSAMMVEDGNKSIFVPRTGRDEDQKEDYC